MANTKNTISDFESLFERKDGCWNWSGSVWKTGYGRFHYQDKSCKAHRLSWMFYVGRVADDVCVLHKCDNRLCVNPDHLFLGSRKDNNLDKTAKGRQSKGGLVNTAKLTPEQVVELRNSDSPTIVLASKFGVTKDHVNKIKRREIWKHV
jgi:hypothetical protein